MKKITITNAYTWYNKGDAGILLGTVNALKKVYMDEQIQINVLSFTPEEDSKRYCQDKTIKGVYSNVLNPHPYKHTKFGKIVAVIKLLLRMIYLYIFSNINIKGLIKKEKAFSVLNESDIIIVCGGGFLGGKKLDSLMHVFQMYINTKFNKPVYVMGTSIEPMHNKVVKTLTDYVLKKMNHIFARETITYDYLLSIIEGSKVTLIPDMAFMLEDKKKNFEIIQNIKEKSNSVYGLTVRKWNFPNNNNPEELMENYINALSNFMTKKILQDNCSFVFVPQVIVKHGDDAEVALEIRNRLPEECKEKFIIIRDDLSPIEIKALIGNFDYFIGTRMHSNIFATSINIPTIAIAYEKKTNGIMHTVGLDDYIIEMDEITEEKLEILSEIQKKNCENIRRKLNQTIYKLRQEILSKLEKILRNEEK